VFLSPPFVEFRMYKSSKKDLDIHDSFKSMTKIRLIFATLALFTETGLPFLKYLRNLRIKKQLISSYYLIRQIKLIMLEKTPTKMELKVHIFCCFVIMSKVFCRYFKTITYNYELRSLYNNLVFHINLLINILEQNINSLTNWRQSMLNLLKLNKTTNKSFT
jgi:hypothetical protein